MKSKKKHYKNCIVCNKGFIADYRNQILCSDKCRYERMKEQKSRYHKTRAGKLYLYRSGTKSALRKYKTELLKHKLTLALLRAEIIYEILKERGVTDV